MCITLTLLASSNMTSTQTLKEGQNINTKRKINLEFILIFIQLPFKRLIMLLLYKNFIKSGRAYSTTSAI